MANIVTPTQNRYNDAYSQVIYEFNNSKFYLDRTANGILNALGQDLVLEGLELLTPTILTSDTVQVIVSAGWAIQDETLIQLSAASTVNIDCSSLVGDGSFLAVFLKYQHFHTKEANLASIDIFHVDSTETVTDTLDRFDTSSCRILLGIINFTKVDLTVTQASLDTSTISKTINGQTYYIRGRNPDNINLDSDLFDISFEDRQEHLIKQDYLLAE
jgi:hypothetical protein